MLDTLSACSHISKKALTNMKNFVTFRPSLGTLTLPLLASPLARLYFCPRKLDFPAFGNNIEEYMQSTGNPDEVTKGRAPDLTPEIVEKFDVAMGEDGVLTLSPKDGGVGEKGEEPPSS